MQTTALLGLISETCLHAGAGSSVGVVDLPIQREGHNGWPCVFGSAVKGALRALAEEQIRNQDVLFSVFGPDTKNASDNAGALMVGDARLLLLPVRSLTTTFKWVTCPEALKRLARDASRLACLDASALKIPTVTGTQALAAVGAGESDLFLEEYRFSQTEHQEVTALASVLASLMGRDDSEDEVRRRLVLVSDDMFSHLAQAAIPVNPHNAVDSGTKTANDGALWYEETLSPETLLYVPLVAVNARRRNSNLNSASVMNELTNLFSENHWLQLGGNETVGMGWCAVTVLRGSN